MVHIFLDEKTFHGCNGLDITDEIRVTVATQACIMALHTPHQVYPGLRTIAMYPRAYRARNSGDGSAPQHRAGESWTYGPVVLAWSHVKGGSRNPNDGRNVVLHEFAHQLDQADGSGDGAPSLETRSHYREWSATLGASYDELVALTNKGKRSFIDAYGATNPAEFFAVATETFFEKADKMRRDEPELYDVLKKYYKLDPAEWDA